MKSEATLMIYSWLDHHYVSLQQVGLLKPPVANLNLPSSCYRSPAFLNWRRWGPKNIGNVNLYIRQAEFDTQIPEFDTQIPEFDTQIPEFDTQILDFDTQIPEFDIWIRQESKIAPLSNM